MKLKSIPACALVLTAATVLLQSDAKAQAVTYTFSYAGPALPIFRDSANIITSVNLFVPKPIRVSKVTANIEVDYAAPGDLNVFLYSPLLTRTKLLERNCGNSGSVANVTFDDAAASKFSDVCPSNQGPYQPNEPLSNYNGQVALGSWRLAVENNGSDSRIGYIRGFTLTITGTPVTDKPITGPNAVYNVASFQSGSVAPGEMINIEGANLGPTTAVVTSGGDLPLTLGGATVTFDGKAAALSYASATVLTAQVPFSVVPGTTSNMVISYGGNTSDPVSLDVVTSVPGIYTSSANGLGIATAVNPDGTLNSASNPVSKGQYVTIYASGLGTVTPALNTGQAPPASPLSYTDLPFSAQVDGITTSVTFAGAAPTFPGLYQVNVTIPTGARTGIDALTIFAGGGAPSQNGVAIFVK
jgi:uncharacterized protein (TIGR03437 family)